MDRLRTGDIFEGAVSDFGMSGEGIVKDGAYPVFVPYALLGERVRLRIVHAKKDYAFGEVIEVLTPSNDRIKPKCRHFGKCGGCDLQHISAPLQEEIKRTSLARTLSKTANVSPEIPPVVCGREWEYRNKLALPFGKDRQGRTVLGFYAKRSHRVIPLKECPLHGEWVQDVIAAVMAWADAHRLSVYDEGTGRGLLRHVVARFLTTLSVVVVVNADELPYADDLMRRLTERLGDVALYVSSNKEATNVILGESVRLVGGEERKQRLGSFSAYISPLSFLQVNDEIRDRIYADVCDEIAGAEGDITELYSGVGLLTAELALRLPDARITAVEIVPDAVRDAKKLMAELGLSDRVKEVCADAAEYMASAAREPGRLLVLDPPRKGCDERVLSAAAEAAYSRIVYISCNPATLARDIKFLIAHGYKLSSVRPYDMFPQTMHVETLAVLERG